MRNINAVPVLSWAGMSVGLAVLGSKLWFTRTLGSNWDTEIFRGRGTSSCATDGMFYPISRQPLSIALLPFSYIFRQLLAFLLLELSLKF